MLDSALIKAENDGYSKGSGKSPGQNQFASRVEVECLHVNQLQTSGGPFHFAQIKVRVGHFGRFP